MYMYMYINIYMYLYLCIHVYVYISIYICTYTYIYYTYIAQLRFCLWAASSRETTHPRSTISTLVPKSALHHAYIYMYIYQLEVTKDKPNIIHFESGAY